MMGEERVNNELILKQYGIIALAGGMLKHKHFEVMRLAIGRHCDSNKKKTFSIYRFINFPLAHFIIPWMLDSSLTYPGTGWTPHTSQSQTMVLANAWEEEKEALMNMELR